MHIFFELLVFNGLALAFLICILILSFIRVGAFEHNNYKKFKVEFILGYFLCLIATILIILVFGGDNFTKNVFLEFFYIFFLYSLFTSFCDVCIYGGAAAF